MWGTVLCLILLVFYVYKWWRKQPQTKFLPPGPPSYPIIGSPVIGKHPHILPAFQHLHKEYGKPSQQIHLSSHPVWSIIFFKNSRTNIQSRIGPVQGNSDWRLWDVERPLQIGRYYRQATDDAVGQCIFQIRKWKGFSGTSVQVIYCNLLTALWLEHILQEAKPRVTYNKMALRLL